MLYIILLLIIAAAIGVIIWLAIEKSKCNKQKQGYCKPCKPWTLDQRKKYVEYLKKKYEPLKIACRTEHGYIPLIDFDKTQEQIAHDVEKSGATFKQAMNPDFVMRPDIRTKAYGKCLGKKGVNAAWSFAANRILADILGTKELSPLWMGVVVYLRTRYDPSYFAMLAVEAKDSPKLMRVFQKIIDDATINYCEIRSDDPKKFTNPDDQPGPCFLKCSKPENKHMCSTVCKNHPEFCSKKAFCKKFSGHGQKSVDDFCKA